MRALRRQLADACRSAFIKHRFRSRREAQAKLKLGQFIFRRQYGLSATPNPEENSDNGEAAKSQISTPAGVYRLHW